MIRISKIALLGAFAFGLMGAETVHARCTKDSCPEGYYCSTRGNPEEAQCRPSTVQKNVDSEADAGPGKAATGSGKKGPAKTK